MRLQIYDFNYNLIWETHECEHWFISNRPDNEHPYSYVQLQFTNRNMETDFRLHLEELSDQRETFFFVIDTHDGLRRCIIFNPRLKIFRPLHNDNNIIEGLYVFSYEYYSMMSTLLNIRDEDFSNFIRQIHQNFVLRTARIYTNEWEECFEKNCSNTFKDILNKEIEELE